MHRTKYNTIDLYSVDIHYSHSTKIILEFISISRVWCGPVPKEYIQKYDLKKKTERSIYRLSHIKPTPKHHLWLQLLLPLLLTLSVVYVTNIFYCISVDHCYCFQYGFVLFHSCILLKKSHCSQKTNAVGKHIYVQGSLMKCFKIHWNLP